MWVSPLLVQRPRVLQTSRVLADVDCDIPNHRNSHVGVSLEAEGEHRDADEEHGHHCYHLSDSSDTWHADGQQVDISKSGETVWIKILKVLEGERKWKK